MCGHLNDGALPIYPGTVRCRQDLPTDTICALVRLGKRVGITANSHKVIRNLIDEVIKLAVEKGINLNCCQKPDEIEDEHPHPTFAKRTKTSPPRSEPRPRSAGGTARHCLAKRRLGVPMSCFVEEAVWMSLAGAVTVSQAARRLVLIGDPRQLDRPQQGSPPDGTDVSALVDVLASEQEIRSDQSLLLEKT